MRTLLAFACLTAPLFGAIHHVDVHGHRGARAVRPENTLPAFRYALETGVDVLELDLAVTKDDVVVVSHDPRINFEICAAKDGKKYDEAPAIRDLTLAELRTFDCGSKKHPRFPKQEPVADTPIPTLEEVFDLAKAKDVRFNVETKIVPREVGKLMPDPKTFAKLVVAAVRKANLESRVIVQSFDHRSLVETRKLAPKIRIAALLAEDLPDWRPLLKALKPDYLSPNIEWITPEAVAEARRQKVKVVPWTLNGEADWTYALDCGVDGIISDDPAPLLAFLRARGRHR